MTKAKRSEREREQNAARELSRCKVAWLGRLAQMAMIVAACNVLVSCGKAPTSTSEAVPTPTQTNSTAPVATQPRLEFQKLCGKWVRPDGGYILELKSASPDGQFEAGYYNPNPIHVAHAVAVQDSGGTRVVVELRDENYPGCLYRLKYDTQTDQLYGTYFQAAVDQTYDVTFERVK